MSNCGCCCCCCCCCGVRCCCCCCLLPEPEGLGLVYCFFFEPLRRTCICVRLFVRTFVSSQAALYVHMQCNSFVGLQQENKEPLCDGGGGTLITFKHVESGNFELTLTAYHGNEFGKFLMHCLRCPKGIPKGPQKEKKFPFKKNYQRTKS